MKISIFSLFFFLSIIAVLPKYSYAQQKSVPDGQVKNVIVMIPDGTSSAVLSLSRWYQWYLDRNFQNLAVDPLICGMVRTHSSNAPIGDSAPTGSCYATGYESQTGFIATYPPPDSADLLFVDPAKAYQPLMTVLEAAKLGGKATGLVFTCEFPHATPADFSAHTPSRKDYRTITEQMINNRIDVVIGGGSVLLNAAQKNYLGSNGWDTVFNDYRKFLALSGTKAWALLSPMDLPFDIDRDSTAIPSLSEMTSKALELLSENNQQGFFLMVEGSKIDWAAHSNDPVGIITEFIAFDKAVQTALSFAAADGNTVVVVLPDHGNSGVSLGNHKTNKGYDRVTADELFGAIALAKLTAEGIAGEIRKTLKTTGHQPSAQRNTELKKLFAKYYAINDMNTETLNHICDTAVLNSSYALTDSVARIISARYPIGFTTTGHTGEDVFLGVYAPEGYPKPSGIIRGRDVNAYLCSCMGIASLNDSTAKYFSPHHKVFAGCSIFIQDTSATLKVTKGKNTLTAKANTSFVTFNRDILQLKTLIVYSEKNKTFYLPQSLGELMKP